MPQARGKACGNLCEMQTQQNIISLNKDSTATPKYAEKGRISPVLL